MPVALRDLAEPLFQLVRMARKDEADDLTAVATYQENAAPGCLGELVVAIEPFCAALELGKRSKAALGGQALDLGIGLAEGGYEAYWNSRMKFDNSVCMVFAWAGPVPRES